MACISRVQRKGVMMYFCLHAFWQNSVIIHKWLATVTLIKASASCQKSKHQRSFGSCRIVEPAMYISLHRKGIALKVEACVWHSRTSRTSPVNPTSAFTRCLWLHWFGTFNIFYMLKNVSVLSEWGNASVCPKGWFEHCVQVPSQW